MTNLPPGVTVGMIPGNRPEDDAEEAFWNALYEKVGGFPEDATIGGAPVAEVLDDPQIEQLVLAVREIAYAAGRAEERADAEIEAAMTPTPRFTDEELAALARLFGGDAFREDATERAAVQKIFAAHYARNPL